MLACKQSCTVISTRAKMAKTAIYNFISHAKCYDFYRFCRSRCAMGKSISTDYATMQHHHDMQQNRDFQALILNAKEYVG